MNRSAPWLNVVKQTLIRLIEHDSFGQAKSAAYSFILFFFPLLLFLVTLLVVTKVLAGLAPQLVELLHDVLPLSTRVFITEYISKMVRSKPTHLLIGASLVMVWTASGMMATFIEGLNRAYCLPTHRSLVKERLVAIALVFLVAIPLMGLALLTIFGSYLERSLATHFNLTLPLFWRLAGRGFVPVAAMGMIAIIYYVGPPRQQTWRGVLPGAGLATVLWFLATLAFSAYVNHFGDYNVIYGSLGAGIVLLTWMYVSSLVVLIGGEFNAALEMATDGAAPARQKSP